MAIQNPTTNYNWTLPTVGGSTGAWGTILNTIIGDDVTGIDKVIKAIDTRLTTAETTLASTPTEAVVNRYIVDASGVYSTPKNLLTALTVQFSGATSAAGIINIDLAAVLAAGGPSLLSTDFFFYTFDGWRASDNVIVQSTLSGTGAGNSIDLTCRFRDGAIVASQTINARIVMYFDAAPA